MTNDRGQVGIGTLIVFIALVLVAAIAAGVLINTAGFLQTQAEATGQQSTDQVSDNINVIGQVGQINVTTSDSETVINETRLTVQRAAGSGDINLESLSIQYVGDNGFAQLTHGVNESDDATSSNVPNEDPGYLIDVITAASEEDGVITDDGDRYEIVIPFDADGNGTRYSDTDDVVADGSTAFLSFDNNDLEDLDEGEQAELELTTDNGATRDVVITAPDTLVDQENGDTVTL
ncbi:archaellin/type IV pilin N-terminal domain-containing protein [Halovenus halobia]|uniref:archaellin/type IV pilin N-terminal domain-containing protein n=1 Tax=Halovenus halobia TaxID=3396622 RepID=UPI003F55418E